jgi:hypothetical protein
MTEPTVMDMVLAELKSIRESIHSLRDDVNGKFATLSSQVAGHEQWIESHERWANEQIAYTRDNRTKLETHDAALSEMKGGCGRSSSSGWRRARRWIAVEAYAHWPKR